MFLVITKLNNTIKVSTTLRKEGFFGRRRQQYVSIYDTIRFIKRLMRKVEINTIGLIYNGWNRFKVAIRNALRSKYYFKIKVRYIRFLYNLPHNGCRETKRRRKKRNKKRWLRKKRFFTRKRKKRRLHYKKLIKNRSQ
jgi:ribosomal protein S11